MHGYKQIWQTVAEDIKENIINNVFKPEARLKETELAEKYGVSKTPVREALRHLASVGFVEIFPNRMARVKKVERKEVEDLYNIQSVLEGLAAREAVPNLTKGHYEKMAKYADLLEKYSAENNSREYEKANINFHAIFWQASSNQKLFDLISNIHEQLQRFRTITRRNPERFRELASDHREIMEAALSRESEKAEKLFRDHVCKQSSYIIDLLEKQNYL